jgi:energy-coupling factor transporter ATP-binding protein EcfA2
MILATGPTGSGKSTTLYATLNLLNKPSVNVITVEDPVEYRLAGINQVQTNVRAGLTFASALRSILRSDPDIVLIGEIRDHETAQIAIEAALTGTWSCRPCTPTTLRRRSPGWWRWGSSRSWWGRPSTRFSPSACAARCASAAARPMNRWSSNWSTSGFP